MYRGLGVGLLALALVVSTKSPVLANGYGEDSPWQFQTTADQANLAAVEALIQEKKAHGFGPSEINTTTNNNNSIGSQTNCNVVATSTANSGTNGATANSPSNTGNSATSTGNSNSSTTGLDGAASGGSGSTTSSGQGNKGAITSGASGSSGASNSGDASQVLNNEQSNTGNQIAKNVNSTACEFTGPLNSASH